MQNEVLGVAVVELVGAFTLLTMSGLVGVVGLRFILWRLLS